MKAKTIVSLLILASLFSVDTTSGAPLKENTSSTPEAVVNDFFQYHFSHEKEFTPSSVEQRKKWLTQQLMEACRVYFEIPQNPDEVPWIDGDPFTNSQEYPDSFSVGKSDVIADTARVPVTFTWNDGRATQARVMMKKQEGAWWIDDLEYADQQTMRRMLAMESDAP